MDELRKKAEALIKKYKSDANLSNQEKLKKLVLVKKILENPKCFFEISIEQAISILKVLEIEDVEGCYKNLVSRENWSKHYRSDLFELKSTIS